LSDPGGTNQLRQRTLLNVTTAEGLSGTLEAFDTTDGIANVPLLSVDRSLGTFWLEAAGAGKSPISVKRVAQAPNGYETDDHLARLWDAQYIRHSLAKSSVEHDELVRLAQSFRMVTAVSGAVVLERKAPYDEAGFTPVTPENMPSVPEPTTWLLLLIGVAVLSVTDRRRRVRAAEGSIH
jgi:hypothetical protein